MARPCKGCRSWTRHAEDRILELVELRDALPWWRVWSKKEIDIRIHAMFDLLLVATMVEGEK